MGARGGTRFTRNFADHLPDLSGRGSGVKVRDIVSPGLTF